MATLLETECRAALTQSFQLLSERLTAELRSILTASYPPSTYLFWFVYDSPHFDDSFPVTFCQMDRSGQPEQVRRLLPEIACAVPSAVIYDPRYEAADLDTWVVASGGFASLVRGLLAGGGWSAVALAGLSRAPRQQLFLRSYRPA